LSFAVLLKIALSINSNAAKVNSLKVGKNGEDFVRLIYGKGTISASELRNRLVAIEKIKNGEIRPHKK
jgi:hypothetical protein